METSAESAQRVTTALVSIAIRYKASCPENPGHRGHITSAPLCICSLCVPSRIYLKSVGIRRPRYAWLLQPSDLHPHPLFTLVSFFSDVIQSCPTPDTQRATEGEQKDGGP